MSCHWCSYEYFDWQTRTFCKSTPDCDDCKRGDIRVCATPNVEYRPFLCRKCRDQLYRMSDQQYGEPTAETLLYYSLKRD